MLRKLLSMFIVVLFLLNFTGIILCQNKDDSKQLTSRTSPEEKARRYNYFYNEKNHYLGFTYSIFIPGLGSLYAHKPVNFLISWLLIGGAFSLSSSMPANTEEELTARNRVLFSGIGIGYLYSLITSWYDVSDYNRKLRRNLSHENSLEAGFYLSKENGGYFSIYTNIRKTF